MKDIEKSINESLNNISQRLYALEAERRLNAAAPEMLVVLKAIVNSFLHGKGEELCTYNNCIRAEKIIAKAEGRHD